MRKIGVIFGGKSGEHEVSLLSATSVIEAIDKETYQVIKIGITRDGQWKYFDGDCKDIANGNWERLGKNINPCDISALVDFALPILHGPYGEDGTIQGLFEMLDLPYGGCGVLSSALCMDKALAKKVFTEAGLPTSKYQLVYREDIEEDIDQVIETIEKTVPYTMFVKPCNMGSSVGISKVRNREELVQALTLASSYDRRLIIEEGINCREVETGVIGNHHPEAAAVGEIVPKKDFYDYTAKYTDDSGTELQIPANLPKEIADQIRDLAKKAYIALDCAGFARVDFFVSKDNGNVYLNEINTIPGFTKYSMFPLLWKEAGVPFQELVERIIGFGDERYHAKNNR